MIRTPRRLMVFFLLVLLLPAAAVVWFGLRLIEQDRALEIRQLRERRESACVRRAGAANLAHRAKFGRGFSDPPSRLLALRLWVLAANPKESTPRYTIGQMRSRRWLLLTIFGAVAFAEAPSTTSIRGKLIVQDGKPALDLGAKKRIPLDGDGPTLGVLNDKRLAGADMEATGHFAGLGLFVVDPIHTKALHVYHEGKRHTISYWCATCSIRTYSPGPCWCCQEDTALDFQDAGKE